MTIRKRKMYSFFVYGDIVETKKRISQALIDGNFENIVENAKLNEFSAKYQRLSVVGQIHIIVIESKRSAELMVVSKTNSNNIFAFFTSANAQIMDAFKKNFK